LSRTINIAKVRQNNGFMDGGELKINMEHDYMIIDHFPST
jgi:hypothetical protein